MDYSSHTLSLLQRQECSQPNGKLHRRHDSRSCPSTSRITDLNRRHLLQVVHYHAHRRSVNTVYSPNGDLLPGRSRGYPLLQEWCANKTMGDTFTGYMSEVSFLVCCLFPVSYNDWVRLATSICNFPTVYQFSFVGPVGRNADNVKSCIIGERPDTILRSKYGRRDNNGKTIV